MKRPVARALVALGIALALQAAGGFAQPAVSRQSPGPTVAEAKDAGGKIYLDACAACHGADGKGVSQSVVGFTQPIRDFTDCRSTAREPESDWAAVVAHGGPARGFSDLMPAFSGVLSPEEIRAVASYLRTFCPDRTWPQGELNLPRAHFTEKAFPEDEAVLTSDVDAKGPGLIVNKVIYEQRFGSRSQFEMAVPFGWGRVEDGSGGLDWASSLGDASVGFKRVLAHSNTGGSIFSATAEIIIPTGDEARGFGKGTFIFEPFVSFGQLFAADFFLQAQAGVEVPFQSSKAENEGYFRLALGKSFDTGKLGRSWTPMVELLAVRELSAGGKIDLDIVPEFQVTLNKRKNIMANVGVRIPVNNRAGRVPQVVFYLIWDWFDGTLFEGW
jgi:mono/diheme cytochrome c family protein